MAGANAALLARAHVLSMLQSSNLVLQACPTEDQGRARVDVDEEGALLAQTVGEEPAVRVSEVGEKGDSLAARWFRTALPMRVGEAGSSSRPGGSPSLG
jgi:hypothetical protein